MCILFFCRCFFFFFPPKLHLYRSDMLRLELILELDWNDLLILITITIAHLSFVYASCMRIECMAREGESKDDPCIFCEVIFIQSYSTIMVKTEITKPTYLFSYTICILIIPPWHTIYKVTLSMVGKKFRKTQRIRKTLRSCKDGRRRRRKTTPSIFSLLFFFQWHIFPFS